MSVFDKLRDKLTGMKSPSDFMRRPLSMEIQARETGAILPYSPDSNEEHELSVTLCARFWANKAQYASARKIAERTLAHLLYSDVLEKVQQIEHAISDGDASAALHWCGKLRDTVSR